MYLSLGSNMGDREANLLKACRALKRLLADFRMSSIYDTLPLYVTDQDRFLNMVVSGMSQMDPEGFFRRIQAIESELGRVRKRTFAKGPRVIDIDILLFGSLVISTETLRIPHPGIAERQFVLIPLIELSPGLREPSTNASYAEMSRRLPDQGVYIFSSHHYNTHPEPGR